MQFLLSSPRYVLEVISEAGGCSRRAIFMINCDIYSILANRMPRTCIHPVFQAFSSLCVLVTWSSLPWFLISESLGFCLVKATSLALRRGLFIAASCGNQIRVGSYCKSSWSLCKLGNYSRFESTARMLLCLA